MAKLSGFGWFPVEVVFVWFGVVLQRSEADIDSVYDFGVLCTPVL